VNFIESGIPGFDELISSDDEVGGIPKNRNMLIYGPSKTGKSIFCNQFIYHGLQNEEPGLYITTDYGIKKLQNNMMDFQWFIQNYVQNQTFYAIDGISRLSGAKLEESNTVKYSSINNPTDLMVKVGIGTRFLYKKNENFRSVIDSLTTLLAFNPAQTVLRLLKAYTRRIVEAGGSTLIAYTEGVAEPMVENLFNSYFENKIRLDGSRIKVEILKDSGQIMKIESSYEISDNGIVVER